MTSRRRQGTAFPKSGSSPGWQLAQEALRGRQAQTQEGEVVRSLPTRRNLRGPAARLRRVAGPHFLHIPLQPAARLRRVAGIGLPPQSPGGPRASCARSPSPGPGIPRPGGPPDLGRRLRPLLRRRSPPPPVPPAGPGIPRLRWSRRIWGVGFRPSRVAGPRFLLNPLQPAAGPARPPTPALADASCTPGGG